MKPQPLNEVKWIDRSLLTANDYNPNHVAPPEMELLKTSILETGWTQPIVCDENFCIIDGFHRWTVSKDLDIQAMTDGKVPIVIVHNIDNTHRRMATIRHNRARGKHGVLDMEKIVSGLVADGLSTQEISARLGMEDEEIFRLTTRDGMPTQSVNAEPQYSKSFVPKPEDD